METKSRKNRKESLRKEKLIFFCCVNYAATKKINFRWEFFHSHFHYGHLVTFQNLLHRIFFLSLARYLCMYANSGCSLFSSFQRNVYNIYSREHHPHRGDEHENWKWHSASKKRIPKKRTNKLQYIMSDINFYKHLYSHTRRTSMLPCFFFLSISLAAFVSGIRL